MFDNFKEDTEFQEDNIFTDEEIDDISDNGSEALYDKYKFIADHGQTLLRVDKFLVDRITNVSRTRIQDAADAGFVFVNEIPVKSNYRVKPGDVVVIKVSTPPQYTELIPEEIPLDIVYEDESVMVVNKPAGMVVHPGHGNFSGTLVNGLAWYFRENNLFPTDDPRPGLVHRIDKNTSGLLVIAKNPESKSNLGMQFFKKTSQRKYIALVWGAFDKPSGTIVGNVGRNPKDRQQMTVFPDGSAGKPAVTHYNLIESFGYVSLVECILETGRTHQIRVHMKYTGHPLFNDEPYGGNEILRGTRFTKYTQFIKNCFDICPRHALHAKTLGFKHPVTGEDMFFDSELPEDMRLLIEKWRTYISNREEI